jgi:hypothetical protein
MGPIEKEVFGYFKTLTTIEKVSAESGLPVRQVRPAVQRLMAGGYLEKLVTPGSGNHDVRYKIRTDWTEDDLKAKPRGAQGKARPPRKRKPKKERFNVLGVWI